MTYPQPDADRYAIGGQSFFRLNTTLISDGDIYESAQGAHGFAIGPDSDISRAVIQYFDDQVARFMNQVSISTSRPFAGNIAARNDSRYAPSNVPGRILIWPDELFDVDWRPTDYDPGAWRLDFERPTIDVVEYFSPIGLQSQRNDKSYQYDQLALPNLGVGGFWGLALPYYGRKFAHVLLTNRTGSDVTNYAIYGLTFSQTGETTQRELLAPATVADDATSNKVIKASTDGMYDYLFIQSASASAAVGGTYPVNLRITVSDRES